MKSGDYYLFDERQLHTLARKWMKSKPEWRKVQIILWTLVICAAISLFRTIIYVKKPDRPALSLIMMTTLLASLIIFIGIVVIFARQNYGFPYLYMQQVYLSHDAETVQLIYHNKLDKQNYISAISQKIQFSSISRAKIDEKFQMLILFGKTEMTRQKNIYCMDDRIKPKVKESLSMFLCFSDKEQFLHVLSREGIPIDYV